MIRFIQLQVKNHIESSNYIFLDDIMERVSSFEYPRLTKEKTSLICENRLCFLFFILCRQRHPFPSFFSSFVRDLLIEFKYEYTHHNELHPYLPLFLQMVLYTRDFYLGKGDRCVSYFLISELYDFFPKLAFCLFQSFVYDNEYIAQPSYGSWKDCQYMCEYLKGYTQQGAHHPMIHQIVQLMNDQLDFDISSWKYDHVMQPEFLSQVAKWLPRENKQFHWLFEKLVIQYTKKHHPEWLSSVQHIHSYQRALNKSRKHYRKRVSVINKALNTFQIHQCRNLIEDVKFETISKTTLCKQKQWNYYCYGDKSIGLCDQTIHHHWQNKTNVESNNTFKGLYSCYEPEYFIRESLYILSLPEHQREYHKCRLQEIWNKQTQFIRTLELQNLVPIVEIGMSMYKDNKTHLYQAMGMALALSWYLGEGCNKGILCVGVNTFWIHFAECETIVDAVETIFNTILYNSKTHCDYNDCFSLLFRGLHDIGALTADARNMKWVLFGRFSNNFMKMMSSYNIYYDSYPNYRPMFCYWNISTDESMDIYQEFPLSNVLLFSGIGFSLFKAFPFFSNSAGISSSLKTIDIVRNCLTQNRYSEWHNGFIIEHLLS